MDTLYPYQLRAYEAIMAGRSIIIQAPTGAGKTRAALYPFFANLVRAEYITDEQRAYLPLPLTCRYAVPMRVLATQFEHEYHEHFTRLYQRRGTRFNDIYAKLGIKLPAIQTGETPDDTLFESPLTFCTIDQLLASFIGTPYSVSPRLANINVGAVVGSYLILDEFHLYPVERGNGARLTSLAMLRMLRQFSPFVLMTATFSTEFLNRLAKLLDADVIQVEPDELLAIHRGDRGIFIVVVWQCQPRRSWKNTQRPMRGVWGRRWSSAIPLPAPRKSISSCNEQSMVDEIQRFRYARRYKASKTHPFHG